MLCCLVYENWGLDTARSWIPLQDIQVRNHWDTERTIPWKQLCAQKMFWCSNKIQFIVLHHLLPPSAMQLQRQMHWNLGMSTTNIDLSQSLYQTVCLTCSIGIMVTRLLWAFVLDRTYWFIFASFPWLLLLESLKYTKIAVYGKLNIDSRLFSDFSRSSTYCAFWKRNYGTDYFLAYFVWIMIKKSCLS